MYKKPYIFAFLLFFVMMPSLADAASIAKVIAVTEGVSVERGGTKMPLALKDDLFVNDVIRSNNTGKAQLIFADDTVVSIGVNSTFTMTAYGVEQAEFKANVAVGFARFVTGSIVDKNPEAFTVRTPEATVGIRGTTFSVQSRNRQTTVSTESSTKRHSVVVGNTIIPPGFSAIFGENEQIIVPVRPMSNVQRQQLVQEASIVRRPSLGQLDDDDDLNLKDLDDDDFDDDSDNDDNGTMGDDDKNGMGDDDKNGMGDDDKNGMGDDDKNGLSSDDNGRMDDDSNMGDDMGDDSNMGDDMGDDMDMDDDGGMDLDDDSSSVLPGGDNGLDLEDDLDSSLQEEAFEKTDIQVEATGNFNYGRAGDANPVSGTFTFEADLRTGQIFGADLQTDNIGTLQHEFKVEDGTGQITSNSFTIGGGDATINDVDNSVADWGMTGNQTITGTSHGIDGSITVEPTGESPLDGTFTGNVKPED